jgi:hypothetical protein
VKSPLVSTASRSLEELEVRPRFRSDKIIRKKVSQRRKRKKRFHFHVNALHKFQTHEDRNFADVEDARIFYLLLDLFIGMYFVARSLTHARTQKKKTHTHTHVVHYSVQFTR